MTKARRADQTNHWIFLPSVVIPLTLSNRDLTITKDSNDLLSQSFVPQSFHFIIGLDVNVKSLIEKCQWNDQGPRTKEKIQRFACLVLRALVIPLYLADNF